MKAYRAEWYLAEIFVKNIYFNTVFSYLCQLILIIVSNFIIFVLSKILISKPFIQQSSGNKGQNKRKKIQLIV